MKTRGAPNPKPKPKPRPRERDIRGLKSIKELTKSELISLIYNTWGDTNIFDKLVGCVVCCDVEVKKYYYICDRCQGVLDD